MNDIFCFNLFNYCGESRLKENKSGPREVLQNGRCKVMVARNCRGRSEGTGDCADSGNILKVVWTGHSDGLDGKRVMEHES